MIIDMECQGVPIGAPRGEGKNQRYWDAEGKFQYRGNTPDSVEESLEFMDMAGIDMAPIGGPSSAGDLNDLISRNNACAEIVKKYPKRFTGLAGALPFGGKPAFDEMERAIKDLGMKAFRITARPEGRHLDSRELWPFYEKVSQLGVPLDVHIQAAPEGFGALEDAPYPLYYIMAREFSQCAETLRICLGGALEDFPDLVVIMHHFGGGVSAIMERLDVYERIIGDTFYYGKPLISKPWREYFNKLYFSMGGREDIAIASIKCALTTISPKKMMFATDWSPNFEENHEGIKHFIEEIRELPLPKEDIEGILGGNAAKVLGI
ncbi:amidohydrolase family protein [Chloroflexota bacterium]